MPGPTSFQRSMFPLQLSLPDWRCQGCQRRGFSSPHRARTHTSLIYHHTSSACQPDKDFSPRVYKLEMLFRLQNQLHICCLPSCMHANERMQKLPGLRPQLILGPGKAGMERELWERHHGHQWLHSYCRALQFTESNFLWPLHQP